MIDDLERKRSRHNVFYDTCIYLEELKINTKNPSQDLPCAHRVSNPSSVQSESLPIEPVSSVDHKWMNHTNYLIMVIFF
jgi:hypothetical protein